MGLLRIGAAVKSTLVAGGVPGNRIFAVLAPELDRPNADGNGWRGIEYRHLDTDLEYGKLNHYTAAMAYIELVCWAVSYDAATTLAELAYTAMQEFRGPAAGITVKEMRLQRVSDTVTPQGAVFYGKRLVFSIVL